MRLGLIALLVSCVCALAQMGVRSPALVSVATKQLSSGAFTPTDYPNLTLWLKGDSITGTDTNASGNVTNWSNSAGSGVARVFNTVNTAYITNSSALNNKPGVRFIGNPNYFEPSGNINANVDNWSAYFVLCPSNNTDGQRLIDSTTGRLIFAYSDNSTKNCYYDGTFRNGGTPRTDAHVLSFVCEAASSGAIYTNGVASATGLGYAQKALTGTTLIGCANAIGNSHYHGIIAEILIYQGAHTASQVGTVTTYLKTKYGL